MSFMAQIASINPQLSLKYVSNTIKRLVGMKIFQSWSTFEPYFQLVVLQSSLAQ